MPGRTYRIAVCEDSPSFSKTLRAFLERDDELEVVGSYETGEELVAALDGLGADLVTMDLELPGMGGLRTIEVIMRERPVPILVLSSHVGERAEPAAAALAAGALEAAHKQAMGITRPDGTVAMALRSRIKLLADLKPKIRVGGHDLGPDPDRALDRKAPAVAMGASVGGPAALLAVLESLPADYSPPVVVVQHIAAGFIEAMAKWLDQRVALPVRLAEDGARADSGVWFAADDAHLLLDPTMHFSLDREPGFDIHRPSLDALFASVADAAGAEAVGVVLTGMGRDGAKGVAAIRAAGGRVIAQDEGTSDVYGMPGAAVEAGARMILPLDEIGPVLRTLRVGARV